MNETKLEPVVLLLFVGMIVFATMLFVCEKFFPNDGQMFQTIAGLLTGFSGAFFMRIKPQGSGPSVPEGGSATQSTQTVVTTLPAPTDAPLRMPVVPPKL